MGIIFKNLLHGCMKKDKNNVSRSNLDNECITSLCVDSDWVGWPKPESSAHFTLRYHQKWPKNEEIPCSNNCNLQWHFPKTEIQTTTSLIWTSIYTMFFLLYLVAFLNIMHYAKVCAFYLEVHRSSNIAASMYIKN